MQRTLTPAEMLRFALASQGAALAHARLEAAEARLALAQAAAREADARNARMYQDLGLDPNHPPAWAAEGPDAGLLRDPRTGAPIEFPDPPKPAEQATEAPAGQATEAPAGQATEAPAGQATEAPAEAPTPDAGAAPGPPR